MYVIGTAGHVDHGKSTLVQALTGIDPDRLSEEKSRGMTIDLGFAWMQLPGGIDVSIVDVPGHERFIKNMLAGVGGIDLAVLVVAADEGVMPQTREHLAILDLLGVRAGVVAVTKRDLVGDEWLELVQAEIEETLAPTTLAGSPIVPVSAVTRAGVDALLDSIAARLAQTATKRDIGRPRLAIDRAFSVAGFGTVVTGTLIDGELRLGQELAILPDDIRTRVRGLQSHRAQVTVARPGSRVAVNVAAVSTGEVHRGQVLTTAGWLHPTTAIDARLRAVAGLARPLRHNTTVTFHTGAAEATAKLRLLDADELAPEDTGWAQFRFDRPLAVARGDGFIIRSPNETLGGGTVVEVRAKRHRRHHAPTVSALARVADGSPEDLLYDLIERLEPTTAAALAKQLEGGEAGVARWLPALVEAGRVRSLADDAGSASFLATEPGFQRLTDAADAALAAYLDAHPLRAGMPREELRGKLGLHAKPFGALLSRWSADGTFTESGATVSLPGREPRLTDAQEREATAFIGHLTAHPYAPQPPTAPPQEVLTFLAEQGRVVPVAPGVVFSSEAYAEMVTRITQHLTDNPTITLAQTRDLFDTSRKYAQALLEHLDERRITRRVGDERVLR